MLTWWGFLSRNWWKVQRWPNPHSCQRYNLESRYEFIRIHLQINLVNNARLPKHPPSAAALLGLAQFPGLVFHSGSVPPYGWVTGNLASAANGRESWITQRLAREIRGFAKQIARRSLTGRSPRHIQISLDLWLATGFGAAVSVMQQNWKNYCLDVWWVTILPADVLGGVAKKHFLICKGEVNGILGLYQETQSGRSQAEKEAFHSRVTDPAHVHSSCESFVAYD